MKVEHLMNAIENLDDRFIEEAAYGVRRKSHIPWGLICAAACFCLVISAVVFLHNAGLIPYRPIGTDITGIPTTTDKSTETTNSTDPTGEEMAEYKDRRAIQALFKDKDSWYYRALVETYSSPKELHLRYYFYNSTELGEGLQPTKEEIDELMELMPDGGMPTLVVLPVSKMDAILTEIFGITVAEMDNSAFAGMKYAESIDSWCFWSSGILNTPDMVEDNILPTVYVSGDSLRFLYRTSFASYEMRLERYGDTYRILSNMTQQPMYEEYPELAEFFEIGTWKHRAILNRYSSPAEADIQKLLCRSYEGEKVVLSNFEEEALEDMLSKLQGQGVWRMTEDQINEILLSCWNVTLDMVEFPVPYYIGQDEYVYPVYLEETGCWYGPGGYRGTESEFTKLVFLKAEEADDGILNMYYMMPSQNYHAQWLARLKRNETGYYVLSVEWVDWETPDETTTPTEPPETTPTVPDETTEPTTPPEWEVYNELFKAYSWYNLALTCEYDSPEQISVLNFFNIGFSNDKKVTDEEKEQLKNMQGFSSPAGDIYRLPPDKMKPILEECFGITLEDLDPIAFNGLAYLESTNCYYFKASGPNGVENFTADKVEKKSDGTISVYYNVSYKGDYVVTIKPHGDSYQVISNRCIHSTSLIPQTPIVPTGDTELEIFFAGYAKVPEKEATQKMVDALLVDPDTFVKLLAKQERDRAILGVLSRNMTDNHPQINAYRAAVSSMLAKDLPENEKTMVYGMALYSGLSNYISTTPTVEDYRLILDMSDTYTYDGETLELLRKFCIEDAAGLVAAVAEKQENQIIYVYRITAQASKEELNQIKEAVTKRKEELSQLSGEGIQEQKNCAMDIIASCNERLR